MMSETHAHWIDRLSAYVDGDLDDAERIALEAHLAECGVCRDVLAELRLVVFEARRLGGVPPERDLWPGIAAAIGAGAPGTEARPGDVIPLPTASEPKPARSGVFLTMPQLAAASIVLALVSAAATLWVGPGLATAPDRSAAGSAPSQDAFFAAAEEGEPPPEVSQELLSLEEALAAVRDSLEPNTLRILEKNLDVIERAIEDSRRALALDPGNAFLVDHLERAYREKAEYLREAASIVEWAS